MAYFDTVEDELDTIERHFSLVAQQHPETGLEYRFERFDDESENFTVYIHCKEYSDTEAIWAELDAVCQVTALRSDL